MEKVAFIDNIVFAVFMEYLLVLVFVSSFFTSKAQDSIVIYYREFAGNHRFINFQSYCVDI